MRIWLTALLGTFAFGTQALGAINCTLDYPDRDVRRLVPQSTTYKVRELIPARQGPKDLVKRLEKELNGPLDGEFETPDTPYTFYAVYKGKEQIGLILGTNAQAVDGPMQLFVVYTRKGAVAGVYVQKISSKDATAFRSKYYREQFRKFTINHLPEEADVKPPVRSPSNDTINDHHSFLRAFKLNMLLVRELYNKFKE